MSDDGQSGDKSSLVLVMSVIGALAGGGGGYAFRSANDVPTEQAQDTAKIRALLDRNLSTANLKLESIQKDLDAIDEKLDRLRDRIGDVCGDRQR